MRLLPILALLLFAITAGAQDATWIKNVTSETGLDSARAAYLYVADLNNDHYPDIILVEAAGVNKGKITYLMNVQREGSTDPHMRYFKDTTRWSSIDIRRNGEHGRVADIAVFADIDNDGDNDCISCIYYHRWEYYHPDSLDPGDRCELLLNKGWGQFELKENSRLDLAGLTNAGGLTLFDIENNGSLDLFIANWFKDYANNIMFPSMLFKGNGDGTFDDISQTSGIKSSFYPLYGSNAVDWDNDGLTDLATCPYCRSSGSLWKNNGNGTFTDVASSAKFNTQVLNGDGWGDDQQTYPKALCTWAVQPHDFDNDGDMDFLYVLVHGGFLNDVYGKPAGRSTIVINNGPDSSYRLAWDLGKLDRRPPRSSHLGDYDAFWFDLDNDMLQDVAIGNGSYDNNTRLFIVRQKSDGDFTDISKSLGITSLTGIYPEIYSMEAIDFDLDGDDDILFTHGNGVSSTKHQVQLVENSKGQANNWIAVSLKAPPQVNKSCIGARITVYSGGVAQMKEITAGFGHFGGQRPFITNFGLAGNTKVDSIVVRWPSNPLRYTKVTNARVKDINIIDENGFWGNLAVNDQSVKEFFRLFPNPARDYLYVNAPERFVNGGQFQVLDLSGKIILQGRMTENSSGTAAISVDGLQAGYYLFRLVTKSGEFKTLSFIIAD